VLNRGKPNWPPIEVTCWMTPPGGDCVRMTDIALRVTWARPKKLMSICMRTCFSESSSKTPASPMPALLQTTSTLLNFSIAAAKADSI